MGGEGQHEKAVYRCDGKVGASLGLSVAEGAEPFYRRGRGAHVAVHVDSEAQVAQQEERFLRAYQMGVLQQGHRAGDFVVEDVGITGEQAASSGVFVFDYFGNDGIFELRDDLGLGDTKCNLIRQLIEVACGLGPLSEEASDGQAHVLCRVEKLLDLACHFQCRQVQHYRDPNSGADVGRAGCEVSQSRAEGIVGLLLYHIVDFADLLCAL